MRTIFILILTSLFLSNCGNKNKDEKLKIQSEKRNVEPKSLLDNVRLAINPKYQNWVLFENGTYIIFDDISKIADIKEEAIKQMKEYGPVYVGGSAGDFNVIHLNQTEGWVVSGHGYGMYTYVNPSELDSDSPNDITIGLFGRSKRNKDGQNPNIIYINNTENN